jgi:hypothetical protein
LFKKEAFEFRASFFCIDNREGANNRIIYICDGGVHAKKKRIIVSDDLTLSCRNCSNTPELSLEGKVAERKMDSRHIGLGKHASA